jgi:Icc-related predicted phosphoesterase
MRICHVSDNHGYFPELPGEFDVVVCSGDFFKHYKRKPNYNPIRRQDEIEFQTYWLKSRIDVIREWTKGKPFIWSSGNHDFINPCNILNENSIKAIDIDNKVIEYGGFVWYGFPYVPMIINEWNWERDPQQMKEQTANLVNRLKQNNKLDKLDILVAHCPINGTLDSAFYSKIGNKQMNSVIDYALQKPLGLYLCGHCHENNGWVQRGNTLFNNGAVMLNKSIRIITYRNNKWTIDATIKDTVIS